MASAVVEGDKYRYILQEGGEKDTKWRFGTTPNYEVVNKLFEEGRTKVWPAGSLEGKVQNLVKSWEMENFHKTRIGDFKTIDTNKYPFSLNGKKAQTIEEIGKRGGGYIPLWDSSLPKAFPREFALEILQVYTGPPVIVYKFRHWGYMEGPFKGHPPTGEMIELFGMAIFELNEEMKIEKVKFFYDRRELLGGLLKGAKIESFGEEPVLSCPFLKN